MKIEVTNEEQLNIDSFSSAKSLLSYSRTGLFTMEKVLIDQYIKKSCKVLDVGCGAGRTTVPLYDMGFDIIGIDISEAMIQKAKMHFPTINFQVGDACNLMFENASFDFVMFSYNGIDYIFPEEKRIKALKEIKRVLRSSGILIFTTHNINALLCHHKSYYRWLRNFIWNNPCRLKSLTKNSALLGKYLTDKTKYGDLITYFINPVNQRKQLEMAGFRLLEIRGHYKNIFRFFEPWPYYIAQKK